MSPVQSPVQADTHTPDALAAAAQQALVDHAATASKLAPDVATRIRRVARWAWGGEGRPDGMRALILEVAEALFRSPADAFHGRPLVADPNAASWVEDLIQAIGSDTPLAQTLIAAAVRLELGAGHAVLPSTLAVLFRVDTSRIRTLLHKGDLEDAAAGHPKAGKAGRRTKGAEARVTAESALRWLAEQGRTEK